MNATIARGPRVAARKWKSLPRWARVLGAIAALTLATQIAVATTQPVDAVFTERMSEALNVVALLLMVLGFRAGARHCTGSAGRAWQLFMAGGVLYLIGDVYWAVLLYAGGSKGVSGADIFWLAAYPFYFAALHSWSRCLPRDTHRGEGLIETLIVMSAFGLLLWEIGIQPLVSGGALDLQSLLTIAYPMADLGLIWVLLRTVYRLRAGWNLSRTLLALGLVTFAVADVLWSLPVGVPYVLYVLSPLLLGAAGVAASLESQEPEVGSVDDRPWLVDLMTYVAGTAVALVPVLQLAEGRRDLVAALMAIAVLTLVFVRIAMTISQNREMRREAERAALLDPLTGLWNHGYFQERLSEEVDRARRSGGTVGLLLIDIDHFKQINDSSGHRAGDELLKTMSAAIHESCRSSDTACRVGGDELAVIAPAVSLRGLTTLANRILEAGRRVRVVANSGSSLGAALSVGACLYPDDAITPAGLIENADRALYQSKREGRGRVTTYDPTSPGPISSEREIAHAQAEVRARELDFRALFESARDPLLITDDQSQIVDANTAACEFTGLTRQQMLSRSLPQFIDHERSGALEGLRREALATGHVRGDFQLLLPDGRRPIVQYWSTAVGRDRHLVTLHDVTADRDARRRLEQSERKFKALFEAAPDPMFILDDHGTLVDVNPAAVNLSGVPRDQQIGTHMGDALEDHAREELISRHEELKRDGYQQGIHEAIWEDGELHVIEYSSTANFVPGLHLTIVRELGRAGLDERSRAPVE